MNELFGLRYHEAICHLVDVIKAKAVLEIGCCEGCQAARLLDDTKLVTLLGIDISLRKQPKLMQEAYLGRYFLLEGNSTEIYKHLGAWKFDLIYIDGGHSYEVVKSDIENYWPLLRSGGILCGDDFSVGTFDNGEVCGVIPAICEFCRTNNLKLYLNTVEDGSLEELSNSRYKAKDECKWYLVKP